MQPDETLEETNINEKETSTERVRRYYRRNPKKVLSYLRKTVSDRVARNRDRKKAVDKYGEKKMKNHDVHHPNGPDGGTWRLAKKDHGRDKIARKRPIPPTKKAPQAQVPKKREPEPRKQPQKAPEKKMSPGTIAVFPGRFQPFHFGHYKVYLDLILRFGPSNVYISTSDKKDGTGQHPLTFAQKKKLINYMFGVPVDNIINADIPHRPTEFLKKFTDDTSVVMAVEDDDYKMLDRSEYIKYDPESKMKGHQEAFYVWTDPTKSNSISIPQPHIRAIFTSDKYTDRAKREIFSKIYGSFDKTAYNMFIKFMSNNTETEYADKITSTDPENTNSSKKDRALSRKNLLLGMMGKKITNTETGYPVTIRDALKWDKGSSTYKKAVKLIKKAMDKEK
jgi:nicotinamide mononucleotide adenylyltransferase